MMLHPNWKTILRKAWSIRLAAIAGLLTGCETILPMFADDLPRGIFSGLSVFVIMAAMVARVFVQGASE